MRKQYRNLLLVLLAVIFSIGSFTTLALLKSQSNSVSNRFFGANVFTLQYDMNAGEDTTTPASISKQRKIKGAKETSHDFTVYEGTVLRDGYTFKGWTDDAQDLSAKYFPGSAVTVTSQESTKTLYAVWEENLKFVVKYDLNFSGAPSVAPQEYLSDGNIASHQFIVQELPENGQYYGYIFLGWAESKNAAAADYVAGDSVVVDYDTATKKAEKTLYAVWTIDTSYINYSIVFDNNLPADVGADAAVAVETLNEKIQGTEHTFTLTADHKPTVSDFDETGLVFKGWSASPEGHVEYVPGDNSCNVVKQKGEEGTLSSVLTLYAVWEREYYIVYQTTATSPAAEKYVIATGALAANQDVIVGASMEAEVSVVNTYEETGYFYKRTGYMLVGFAEKENDRTPVENVTLTTPGRNHAKVLYAIWTEGTFAVVYDANGGSGAPEAQVVKVTDTSYTFTVKPEGDMRPSEGAYDAEFLGWAFDSEASTPDFVYNSATGKFSPEQITLTELKPSITLHAVWKYHYVLTFDKGYGDEGCGVPPALEFYTTSKKHTFDIPAASAEQTPYRTTYEFMGYWSDELERTNGENRYYDGSYGDDFDTFITLTSAHTHVTIYARFDPLSPFSLKFDANGGSNAPEDITKPDTEDWQCIFLLPDGEPTKSYATFVGWSDRADADYTWLTSDDPERQLYGGRSGNNTYIINGDKSVEQTMYAVWAPDHYVRVSVDYNGGSGWYQTTSNRDSSGCEDNADYRWDTPVEVTSPNTYWGRVVKFDEYWNSTDNVFVVQTVGGSAPTSGSTGSKLYAITREGYTLRGFSAEDNDPTPDYSQENGNLSVSSVGTKATVDSSSSSGNFRHSGYYTIENVPVDMDTAKCNAGSYGAGGNYYTVTLKALWKSNVDYYRIVMIDPDDNNKATELKAPTKVTITEGQPSSCTFAANTIYSPLKKDGYICDWAYTPNATQAAYKVSSQWVAQSNQSGSSDGHIYKVEPYQNWYNASAITLTPTSTNVTKTYDATLLSDVYTLTVYPYWEKGQIFQLTVNSPSSYGGTLGKKYWSVLSWDNYITYTSDTVKVTARATDAKYTWAAGTAGEFYGIRTNDSYRFLGYSYTSGGRGNVDFTVASRETEHVYNLVINYKGKQRWDRISQDVVVDKNDSRVTKTTNSNGIPVSTLNLYAVWNPYKTYSVIFNENGGVYSEDASTKLEATKQSSSSTEYTFESKSANRITVPTRENYELLGFAYTKARADSGNVDVTLKSYTDTEYYFNENIVVKDKYDTATEGEREVTVSTSSAPYKTILKMYAVWQPKQAYKLIIDYNTGTYKDEENVLRSQQTHTLIVGTEVTSCDFAVTPGAGTLSGYKLMGYSYEKLTPGTVTAEQLESIPFVVDENGQIKATVVKNDPDTTHDCVTEVIDGVEVTTLKLYAVWAENATYYRVHIVSTLGTEKSSYISRTVSNVSNSYTLKAGATTTFSLYGFRLAGLSYEDDGVIGENDIPFTNDATAKPILIEEGGANVTKTTSNNINTYTLKMYAVWERQNLFEVVLDPNKGSIIQETGTTYSTAKRQMYLAKTSSASGNQYFSADMDVRELTIPAAYINGAYSYDHTNYPMAKREEHIFLNGISYGSNSDTVNYALSSVNTGSNYRQRITDLSINLDDPSMNITSRVVQAEDGSNVTMYTLTVYPTFQKQQYFKVSLNPNGGTFTNSSGTVVSEFASSVRNAHGNTTGTVASFSYATTKDIYTTNPGYILKGFSYTQDGPMDIPITLSNSNKTVTLPAITVDKVNTAGKTVVQTFNEVNGDQIEVNTLVLYAVWGNKVSYSSASGTQNMPSAVERIKPEANNREYVIPEVKPVNGKYTFLGWSSTSGGVAEYGAKGYYLELNNQELKSSYILPNDVAYQTLYAVWAQKYELRYAANGGVESTAPVNVISYSTASREALSVSTAIPVREGYTFLGWADTSDATEAKYSATDKTLPDYVTIVGATDGSDTVKTVYAVWKSNTDTVDVTPEPKVTPNVTPTVTPEAKRMVTPVVTKEPEAEAPKVTEEPKVTEIAKETEGGAQNEADS